MSIVLKYLLFITFILLLTTTQTNGDLYEINEEDSPIDNENFVSYSNKDRSDDCCEKKCKCCAKKTCSACGCRQKDGTPTDCC